MHLILTSRLDVTSVCQMARGPWKKYADVGGATSAPDYYTRKKREWRAANPERVRADGRARSRRFREFLWSLKRVPCTDCGVQYPPYVMDFDHRDPTEKSFTISAGASRSVEQVIAEIAKCDVVCANCHRIRTWAQER